MASGQSYNINALPENTDLNDHAWVNTLTDEKKRHGVFESILEWEKNSNTKGSAVITLKLLLSLMDSIIPQEREEHQVEVALLETRSPVNEQLHKKNVELLNSISEIKPVVENEINPEED